MKIPRTGSKRGEYRVVKAGISLIAVLPLLTLLVACSATGPSLLQGDAGPAAPTADAATRATPVVVGRPARMFVFAALGAKCEPIDAPQITVTEPPGKGEISYRPNQSTTIAASAKGTCVGKPATGTAVYYNARAGAEGIDRFTMSAQAATGETVTRTFEVRIEP